MRWLGFFVVLLAASPASAAPASNPSFLGIEMDDIGPACSVHSVTSCSPAQDAGLRFGDMILAVDGTPIATTQQASCTTLQQMIIAHMPGDAATFQVRRGSETITIKAVLSTRADVQHRCLVDQPLVSLDVVDVDDRRPYELDEDVRGATTILGWFRLDKCVGCSRVFDRVSDGIAKRLGGDNVRVLGVTSYDDARFIVSSARTAAGFSSTVSLAATVDKEFEDVMFKERDRVQFMVVDSRGIVRFVAPIAPDSEDLEAAIDEVLAAAQQVEHARTQRR